MFWIWDKMSREHLLREPDLTLKRTDEICHSAESVTSQLKLVENGQVTSVTVMLQGAESGVPLTPTPRSFPECYNCGRKHDTELRDVPSI